MIAKEGNAKNILQQKESQRIIVREVVLCECLQALSLRGNNYTYWTASVPKTTHHPSIANLDITKSPVFFAPLLS